MVARYQGEGVFEALGRSKRDADHEYVIGEIYRLERIEERSEASHRSYFAAIREAWANLPEHLAERFPTPEHLRKYALIRCGYATQRQHVCASKAEAQRFAAFVRPIDEYSIVTTQGNIVTVWTASSQSYRAMKKQRFLESQRAVRDYCASLIGVNADNLQENAGKAA
ncbi:hypothetical protein C4587_00875 [Candidatus Parcubacteria bacterium]|nr:MAG: hypothetical protein C4587_00875 [Candidatus Parcubacteria bacterium]